MNKALTEKMRRQKVQIAKLAGKMIQPGEAFLLKNVDLKLYDLETERKN